MVVLAMIVEEDTIAVGVVSELVVVALVVVGVVLGVAGMDLIGIGLVLEIPGMGGEDREMRPLMVEVVLISGKGRRKQVVLVLIRL